MKKPVIIMIMFILFRGGAFAGYLSGNSSPYVEGKGAYAFKINTSILMAGTPFSMICLSGKYGVTDNIGVSMKCGMGTVDYSTISGARLTTDPVSYALGFEYVLTGSKEAEYSAFVAEAENASWSLNRESNTSSEILYGMDYSYPTSKVLRTRYRLAVHNFYAGEESEGNIASSLKYSLSTELEYSFSANFRGCFEAGMYFGDPIGGIITLFGLGLGYNF